jgi:hypothetical protein
MGHKRTYAAHKLMSALGQKRTLQRGARTPTSKAADRLFVTGLGTNAHLTFLMEGELRTEGQKYVRMKYGVRPCHLSER